MKNNIASILFLLIHAIYDHHRQTNTFMTMKTKENQGIPVNTIPEQHDILKHLKKTKERASVAVKKDMIILARCHIIHSLQIKIQQLHTTRKLTASRLKLTFWRKNESTNRRAFVINPVAICFY